MQVLKEEIRQKILSSAEMLLFNYGFEKMSMRDLALEVEISVSNLYKYFLNKEEIFQEVVDNYAKQYAKGFQEFISHPGSDTFDEESRSELVEALFGSIQSNHRLFYILMQQSGGTAYEGFKDIIAARMEQHIKSGINPEFRNEFMITVLVRNFFHGLIAIAYEYQNDLWAFKNIRMLVEYHMTGMSKLYQ